MSELLGSIVPDITRVRPVQRSNKVGLEFTQQWAEQKNVSFDAAAMSDGTLYSLGMLVALMQQPTPPLIVIEEPEIMIHPGGLGTIQELIQIAARRSQVVITTHSPELLDAEWVGPENLRVVHWENGATRISRLSTGAVRALQQHLMGAGELFRANALDSPVLPSATPLPLFDPVLA